MQEQIENRYQFYQNHILVHQTLLSLQKQSIHHQNLLTSRSQFDDPATAVFLSLYGSQTSSLVRKSTAQHDFISQWLQWRYINISDVVRLAKTNKCIIKSYIADDIRLNKSNKCMIQRYKYIDDIRLYGRMDN